MYCSVYSYLLLISKKKYSRSYAFCVFWIVDVPIASVGHLNLEGNFLSPVFVDFFLDKS